MSDNEKEFENFVRGIKFDDTPDSSHRDKLEQDILVALAKRTLQQQRSLTETWRIIMKSRITKLATAAAAVLIVGLVFLVGDGEQTLYAQVLKALEKVRTIHVVIKEYRNDKWFKDHEMWYDREAGIIEQERYQGRTDVRIDNGRYEWRYAEGNKLIARIKSYRDNYEIARELCAGWLQSGPNRVPSSDVVIDGIKCKMYALSGRGEKVSIWVDGKNRVRKFESVRELNGQKVESRATVEYDIVIDQNRFSPKFGADVELINPLEWIEKQYPLDTAIFTRECLGLVFCVHELKACENGLKYLVCSDRLSEETRRKIGTGHPWTFYGDSSLRDRYDEADTYDYPVLLGRVKHDTVHISWYLLFPYGDRVTQATGCDVDVVVSTINRLAEKCKAERLPTWEKFRLNIAMHESQKRQASLNEIISRIYSLGKKLDPIVHYFRLTEVISKLDGEKIETWRRPVIGLSEEEYRKDVERRIQEWLERNK